MDVKASLADNAIFKIKRTPIPAVIIILTTLVNFFLDHIK